MNQVAEATSVSGDDPHYAAGHAIDGGMQTRWAAAVNGLPLAHRSHR